jgi:hypothetical protein
VDDDAERAKLEEWTRSAIDAAIYAGLVTLPWRPAEHVYDALAGYYTAGLTPAEGAEALFATRQ